MKVSQIKLESMYLKHPSPVLNAFENRQGKVMSLPKTIYNDSVAFGIRNSYGIRKLFKEGMPCMYTGVEMIDSPTFQEMVKNNLFNSNAKIAIRALSKFKKSFQGKEKLLFNLLKLDTLIHSPKSLSESLQNISNFYEASLVKKQIPIMKKVIDFSKTLPDKYTQEIQSLVDINIKKIRKEPVIIPFSKKEFLYKLGKIKADVDKSENPKAKRVINKMLKVAQIFALNNDISIEEEKNTIKFLNIILKKSVLKNNPQLKTLIKNSDNQLKKHPILLPFSRKTFLYDLGKIISDLPVQTKEKIFSVATKLPTSFNSFSAFVMKISKESSDKIAYRICWPYFASVEHIHPASLGGEDIMANFGGACTRANSIRQNIDFIKQLKRYPKIPKFCQKYVNRLLKYKRLGILKKCKVSEQYIKDFANAIEAESKGQLKLKTAEPWYYKYIY